MPIPQTERPPGETLVDNVLVRSYTIFANMLAIQRQYILHNNRGHRPVRRVRQTQPANGDAPKTLSSMPHSYKGIFECNLEVQNP